MRVPNAQHRRRDWVITQVAPDFRLLDAWEVPATGTREDFETFLTVLRSLDPAGPRFSLTRILFWVRLRLGAALGWDDPTEGRAIPGSSQTSLAERLPQSLRGAGGTQVFGGAFSTLYRTDTEVAAELANRTVHGVVHIGWVEREDGSFGAQLGIYVKPRGALGEVYLKAISPFRHLIVYPALMRRLEGAWNARTDQEGHP